VQVALRVFCLVAFVLFFGFLTVVELNLFENKLLVLWDLEAEEFKIEVEVTNKLTSWLIIFEVKTFHVRVGEGLFDRNSAIRVKCQHLLNQVDSLLARTPEQLIKILAAIVGQLSHKHFVIVVLDLVDERRIGLTNQVSDHHHLLLFCLSGEKRLATNQLSEDAAN